MGDRLKKLLDKANAQVKLTGNEKKVKLSNIKPISDDKITPSLDELTNVNEFPVKTNPIEIPKKNKRKTNNENDEIKAYLNQLSRKTRPEQTEKKDENSWSEISELSSVTLLNEELKRKSVSKYNSNQDEINSKPSTALERLSHYEQKYLKNQPRKSSLLDSESDISLFISDKNEIEQKPDLIEEENDENIENNSIEDVSSVKFEDLHLIDELPEIINSFEKSNQNELNDIEEIESKISIPETIYDETANTLKDISTSSKSTSSTDSEIEISDQIQSDDEPSENLLQNIRFDTLSESRIDSPENRSSISIRETPKITKIKTEEIGTKKSPKSHRNVGIQTNFDLNLNFTPKPIFDYELEPTSSLVLTKHLIRQGTLDSLSVANPFFVAFDEMMKQQINFIKTFYLTNRSIYTDQIANLLPDHRYTTWDATIEDVAEYKKKMEKKNSIEKKKKEERREWEIDQI